MWILGERLPLETVRLALQFFEEFLEMHLLATFGLS